MAQSNAPLNSLPQIRRVIWNRLKAWDFIAEIGKLIEFGELRIVFYEGKLKDVHVELHVRDDQ